ncbi:tautomerase family protein [Mesorhizobium sp. 128a]
MPTYTVTVANLTLTKSQKGRLAKAITDAHHLNTGAPGFFAQVIFNELGDDQHFIGGEPNVTPHVFVHGLIRGGRAQQVKQSLMSSALERLLEIVAIDKENVWFYLQDIEAPQMLEFGRFLPEPGAEDEWRRGISAKKLTDLQRAGVNLES